MNQTNNDPQPDTREGKLALIISIAALVTFGAYAIMFFIGMTA